MSPYSWHEEAWMLFWWADRTISFKWLPKRSVSQIKVTVCTVAIPPLSFHVQHKERCDPNSSLSPPEDTYRRKTHTIQVDFTDGHRIYPAIAEELQGMEIGILGNGTCSYQAKQFTVRIFFRCLMKILEKSWAAHTSEQLLWITLTEKVQQQLEGIYVYIYIQIQKTGNSVYTTTTVSRNKSNRSLSA